jgi:hypothetical protein
MNSPTRNQLTLCALAIVTSLSAACSSISVNRAESAYAARGDDCAISWEMGSYDRLSADYEWIGEVTVHNERGLTLSDSSRDKAEAQACELGGDTLLRATDSRSTNLASFDNHKLGVLRRRAPADTTSETKDADDAPQHEAGERVAGANRRSGALLR